MLALIAGLSVVATLLTTGAVTLSPYAVRPPVAVLLCVGVYALPTVLGGEAIHSLVPSYPRNWGYYLATVSAVLAAVLVPVAFLAGGAWNLLWLALGVAFLNSFEVLTVSDGLERFPLLGVASAVQPVLMAVGLSLALPALARPPPAHARAVAVLFGVGVGLGLVSVFVEWLLDVNVTEVDGLEITSNLVQRADLHLGMGFPTEPIVQTFAVETDRGRATIAAPWIHPGVLEGIGGGRLTRETIHGLSDTGADVTRDPDSVTGFFFHVPCSHISNAADPEIADAVIEATETPVTVGRASRLISRTYDGTTFHGRRYGDSRVVYVESDHYGDFEISVFGETIDPDRTLLVDRHVRADECDREFVFPESAATAQLRSALEEFLDVLESQPLATYRAGTAVDLDLDGPGISLFAMVENVDGQRVLLLGADQNEDPRPLIDFRNDVDDEYDEVVLFTTDTHGSVYGERFDPQVAPGRIRSVVESAAARVSDAAAGVGADRASETPLLRWNYFRLMYSLNLVARVYILLLAAMYGVLLVAMLTL